MGIILLLIWAAIGYARWRWWTPLAGAIIMAPVVAGMRYERYSDLFGAAEASERVIWDIATGIPLTALLWSGAYWLGRGISHWTGGPREADPPL